jgi:hypothetical protein
MSRVAARLVAAFIGMMPPVLPFFHGFVHGLQVLNYASRHLAVEVSNFHCRLLDQFGKD